MCIRLVTYIPVVLGSVYVYFTGMHNVWMGHGVRVMCGCGCVGVGAGGGGSATGA